MEELLVGLIFLVLGAAFLLKRKEITDAALLSQESFWKVFGVQQHYTKLTTVIAKGLLIFMSLSFIAVGIVALYAFATGQKFPLQWSDLWPF